MSEELMRVASHAGEIVNRLITLVALGTAAAVVLPCLLWRYMKRAPPATAAPPTETAAAVAARRPPRSPLTPKPEPTASSTRGGKARKAAHEAEMALPEFQIGQKVWHRQSDAAVVVAAKYYDDLPPYYAVRFADGSERSTVRMRLGTLAERAEQQRAARLGEERAAQKVAEQRADAAAESLLAEEAQGKAKASKKAKGAPKKAAKKAR